jgi:hypothetical protein
MSNPISFLTARQREYLEELAKLTQPVRWTGPNKAMGNKLVSIGAARYRVGYPIGFEITPFGRSLIEKRPPLKGGDGK